MPKPTKTPTKKLGWFFPPLNGGEETGLNEAGIENFKQGPRLAREVVQNCLDNRDGSGKPVVVTFELLKIPVKEFPNAKKFRKVFGACRAHVEQHYGAGQSAANEKGFFDRAESLLKVGAEVPALRIGDENTTGLVGLEDERTKSYWRLIRGQGYSTIQGPGGGTYGIGQRAPFAHSDVRTILYSTKLQDGSTMLVGKAILSNFALGKGLKQNRGWWCRLDQTTKSWEAIRDPEALKGSNAKYRRYLRTTVGTDLYVMGYSRENWLRNAKWSVLENFFAALGSGDLRVRFVDGNTDIELHKQNLDEELQRAVQDANARGTMERKRKLEHALYYHRALTEPHNGKPFSKDIDELGTVKLYIHRDQKAPDRWCKMRSPRMIVESHGSRRIRGYAGVLLCDSDKGNTYLAALEDPAHSIWSVDQARGWNQAQKRKGAEVLKQIRAFVRETLESLRQVDDRKTYDIPNLGRYLPLEGEPEDDESRIGRGDQLTGESTPIETGERRTRPNPPSSPTNRVIRRSQQPGIGPKTPRFPAPKPGASGGEQDGGGGQGNGKSGPQPKRPGPGASNDQSGKGKTRSDSNVRLGPQHVSLRSFRVGSDTRSYRLVLRSKGEKVQGSLQLAAIGEDRSSYGVKIMKAKTEQAKLTVDDGKILGVVVEDQVPTVLEVTIETDVLLALALKG